MAKTIDDNFYPNAWANSKLDKDYWSVVGPSSLEQFNELSRVKLQILQDVGFMPHHNLLDVGCGTGLLAQSIQPFLTTGTYYGSDIAHVAINFCRNKYRDHNMHFIRNDQTSIPIKNKKFDFIVFFSVFTHAHPDETEKLLLEAKRLSTDSTIIIADIFSSSTVNHWDWNSGMTILEDNVFNDIAKRLSLITVKEMDLSLEPCKRVLYFLGNK